MLRECSPPSMCHMSHVTCYVSRFTCHVSHVTCHMSRVTCHVSHVTCHVSHIYIYFILFVFGQSGGAYRWRVCYQRGLPRPVFKDFKKEHFSKNKRNSCTLNKIYLFVIPSCLKWPIHLSPSWFNRLYYRYCYILPAVCLAFNLLIYKSYNIT